MRSRVEMFTQVIINETQLEAKMQLLKDMKIETNQLQQIVEKAVTLLFR